MKYFDVNLLQKWTQGTWTSLPQLPIENFCFDTRKLDKNECFLAIKNEHNDGHNYVSLAEKTGAIAAIVEYPIPGCKLPQLVVKSTLKAFQAIAKNYRKTLTTNIVGITGSCGKTTAKELLALLLGPNTFKTQGNFNNHLGLPYSITQIDSNIHKNAVIEVGINLPNEMDILADMLQPNDACLLNVAPVHLQNFTSLEAIANEKFKLLNFAKNNIYYSKQWHTLNRKNTTAYVFTKDLNHCFKNPILYQTKPSLKGWEVCVNNVRFSIPFLVGDGTIETFAICIGIALQKGIPSSLIQQRLHQWQPFENRGEWKTFKNCHYFIDCYNANPLSFVDSLQHFYKEAPTLKNVCFVLGSMAELGPQSYAYHKAIAHNLRISYDNTFVCIGEFKDAIAEGLRTNGATANQIYTFESAEAASTFFKNSNFNCIYLKGSHCYHLENLVAES